MNGFWPTKLVDLVAVVTGAVVVIGGIAGLVQYLKGLRLEGAKILLTMEEEFREILPTYSLIEGQHPYQAIVAPLLRKIDAGQPLNAEEQAVVDRLDRCFRFFYLCSVLNRDLGVDEGALNRAYYHYIGDLLDENRPELCAYLREFYPRLCRWIDSCRDRGEIGVRAVPRKGPGAVAAAPTVSGTRKRP
jgi:hypothetical protein